jgi:hypothetical protein
MSKVKTVNKVKLWLKLLRNILIIDPPWWTLYKNFGKKLSIVKIKNFLNNFCKVSKGKSSCESFNNDFFVFPTITEKAKETF